MSTDGGLRKIFADHLTDAMWQSVETGGTGLGIPDAYYCFQIASGWIEYKLAKTDKLVHPPTPQQIAWSEKHLRAGGRSYFAVRFKCENGPRRKAADELYLFDGYAGRHLIRGLSAVPSINLCGHWAGGPANWKWDDVKKILTV